MKEGNLLTNRLPKETHQTCWALLLLYTAFIVYASIIPLQYFQIPQKPIWHEFLYGWQNHIQTFDVIQNILFYVPLGFFLFLSLLNLIASKLLISLLCLVCSAVLSTSLELTQAFNTIRTSSLLDFVLNSMSGFIGAFLALIAIHIFSFDFRTFCKPLTSKKKSKVSRVIALVFFMGWIAYHLYPYVPSLHPGHIKNGLKPLYQGLFNLDALNSYYILKYFIQGLGLYWAGYICFKPVVRIILLYVLICSVLMLKIIIISRSINLESTIALFSAITLAALVCTVFELKKPTHQTA